MVPEHQCTFKAGQTNLGLFLGVSLPARRAESKPERPTERSVGARRGGSKLPAGVEATLLRVPRYPPGCASERRTTRMTTDLEVGVRLPSATLSRGTSTLASGK